MQVSACAVGQSSAAILALGAGGAMPEQLLATQSAIAGWLAGEKPLPEWPEFDTLAPALPHTGRHGALLLPWNAAIQALSTRARSG